MNMNSPAPGNFSDLDDDDLYKLSESNKVQIQRSLAEAAHLRADQASIRAEFKRRERDLYT